ncbi:MAG: glutathione S-transferase family protein [Deltaproteobacteria bacterium]|nr:glutathione S-transferase family protein [Deltaproteobacteria bacterium]
MLRLYDNHLSGNGYKPRLLLAHLGRTYERVEVDILTGETRTPEFLAINPNGRIPVLELEDGTCIAESNAILFFLAEGSRFLPSAKLARALCLQWMFFEQYSHEPCIAVARHWIQHVEMTEAQRAQLPAKQEGGRAALAVMEQRLGASDWFGGEAMSIADIALYAYTHVAGEGGFDLSDYPAINAWLARVAGEPGHVPMNPAPAGVVEPADS